MKAESRQFPADSRRPSGACRSFGTQFPTLKRGANRHCASGAARNKPTSSTKHVHAIALASIAAALRIECFSIHKDETIALNVHLTARDSRFGFRWLDSSIVTDVPRAPSRVKEKA
jgi:hypothetical protein